ncbi:orotidine-5'-phosphate decarboxylase [Rhodocytophaga rosea]|uniref:Orotidine-5'-phosphate decarboxylase n=1 Tax=Rhodocytophaga rosea TaxID=2704465 RepID=A0A6C0GNQ8_9BACT|nr:orotidine-5'-phosphate decarboxylase [Rhodocytophaga rosea]QHT69484.1 orotidine-5'-phosphate decarboxylase [Rhodocytophaga rosea]
MTKEEIFNQIKQKQSYLCVGLDTVLQKIPRHLHSEKDPVFEFNKQIIDATADFCVAYKPNTAFYEALGSKGWESLQKTLEYIPDTFFKIADAKRGDIGNTSQLYARAFFEQMQADAITVAPYMGKDSVTPFLGFPDKWVILLALTSNPGSADFQTTALTSEEMLFEKVISVSSKWADASQLMYVVGATKAEQFKHIRKLIPEHFLLVPGVGTQGGDLALLSQFGMNKYCGLLVNASRSVIYASNGKDFAVQAANETKRMQEEMAKYLEKYLV